MSADKIQTPAPNKFLISKYLKKIKIDFEELPQYVIQKGIVEKFEDERFHRDSDYVDWRYNLISFLETIPERHVFKTLEKGLEYGKKVYQYHLTHECKNPVRCLLAQSWDRRIGMTETILSEMVSEENTEDPVENSSETENGQITIPIIKLSSPERLWLQEIYARTKSGMRFTFKEIRGKLHTQLPLDFRPVSMDEKLVSSNGEEIRLLGVIALEKDFTILLQIDKVINSIREIILSDPEKRNIDIMTIAEMNDLSVEQVSLSLRLARDYGDFYRGSSYDAQSTILKAIDVGGSDAVYYEYIQFTGIECLIIRKSYNSTEKPNELFSDDEILATNEKLDTVLKELQTLKMGHEIIWTDLMKELQEMKELYSLSKKNWRQLFAGKIFEMVAGGVISETVSKKIVEVVNPVIANALN